MERIDKIFTILVTLGLVAVLVHAHRPRKGVDGVRVNVSALPKASDSGPAYLLSALPSHRRRDDYADPASYYAASNSPYQPDIWD